MCNTPSVPKAQQFQTAVAPVYQEANAEDENTRRGRRATILSQGMDQAPAATTAAGKTALGQ